MSSPTRFHCSILKNMADSAGIVSELQLLLSMYDKSQVHFDDAHLAAQLESLVLYEDVAVESSSEVVSKLVRSTTSFTVTVSEELKIHIRIPLGYPETEKLSAHCKLKCSEGSDLESKLNYELSSRIKENGDSGFSISIFELIDFCKETLDSLESLKDSNAVEKSSAQVHAATTESTNHRIWIHSHHIYNRHKRKFLVDTADQLGLSGFSCPGKPGFICVEGREEDCEEYWSRVRQLTWQKISLIAKEVDIEKCFQTSTFEELRCDKSQFIKYLEDRSLSNIIKDYLGF